jgi:3-oxoacyl-[acyl-carrier protein] reductase
MPATVRGSIHDIDMDIFMGKHRTAIITGAASGIGRATAELMASRGFRLALVDRSLGGLEQTAATCGKDNSAYFVCDVTDEAAVTLAVEHICKQFDPVDILVNCAGIARYAPFAELAPDDWRRMFDVNVMGTLFCTRAVLPEMIARGRGIIVNVGSHRGIEPKVGTAAYSASKAAVLGMTRALAAEVGSLGVKVTYLAPGGTNTGLGTPPDSRFMQPSAIAQAIVFVCETEQNAWVRDLVVLPLGL